jgi:cytochrome P450
MTQKRQAAGSCRREQVVLESAMTAKASAETNPERRDGLAARRLPGPKGLPFLGNLLEFSRDVLRYYTEWTREYGDIVALRLGGWPAVLINRPDYAEYVLVKNPQNFIKFPFFFRHVRAIFGQGLLTSEGELWHRQRRLAAPAFHSQRLAGYGDATVRYTERMLDNWQPDDLRDVHADIMALTLRIAAKALFDAEVERDVAQIGRAFSAVVEEIAFRLRRAYAIPDAIPLPGNIRYVRGVRRIDRLVTKIIRERRERGEDRGDLLSMLMLARDDEGQPMSEKQLRDEVITLLLAGHETTAVALSWTWYLLAQHPDADASLAAELQDVLGGRAPTVGDLPQLRFTEQVVTEAMRLYPPAWGFGREALADCEIDGYAIPAGTTIIISPWVTHRDPRYFEQPTAFRPERWSGDFARQLPRFAYMPFGGGPRICIGNRFAMMEAVLILATMAQRFRLQWDRTHPVVPLPSITLRPKGGVWVKPAARGQ